MITTLLQKQLEAVRSIIYSNLFSFVKHFFGEDEVQYLPDLDFIIFFGVDFLLVEEHWVDDQGIQNSLRLQINYKDYHDWFKGLNNNDIPEKHREP